MIGNLWMNILLFWLPILVVVRIGANAPFDFLNASFTLDRSFLYKESSIAATYKASQRRALGLYRFRMARGFLSDQHKVTDLVAHYKSRMQSRSHYCPSLRRLLNIHLVIDSESTQLRRPIHPFHPLLFLNMLRGKKIGFYGDSILRQIYLDLAAELADYQTKMEVPEFLLRNFHNKTYLAKVQNKFSSLRSYAAFNVTLVYVDSGYGDRILNATQPTEETKWDQHLFDCEMVVIGIGAWHKPLFPPNISTNYYIDMQRKLGVLNNTLWSVREFLAKHNPSARVVWRVNPHAAFVDEVPHISQSLGLSLDTLTTYRNDWNWFARGQFANGAVWPMYYNTLYPKVALHYQDVILDYWDVSLRFLEYAGRLEVISDAMHYCVGGVPRAGVFLLHHLLAEMELKRERSPRTH